MGFGSYDESEQKDQSVDEDDNAEAVNVHEDHDTGDVSFESEKSTDELVSQLQDMKGDEED